MKKLPLFANTSWNEWFRRIKLNWWDKSNWWWWLLAVLITVSPSNLFLNLHEASGYVNGLRVDYLIPKLYVSDLVMLLLVLSRFKFGFLRKISWTKVVPVGLMISVVLLRQFYSAQPLTGVFSFLHLLLVGSLTWIFRSLQSEEISQRRWLVSHAICTAVLFQSAIAIWQFLTQAPLLPYRFLGESNLRQGFGLATATWQGREWVLPYGTTAHPNILAGWLVVMLVGFLLVHKGQRLVFVQWLTLGLGLVTLFLTQSISAWLSLGLVSLVFSKKISLKLTEKRVLWLNTALVIVLIFSPLIISELSSRRPLNESVTRRAQLNSAASKMISTYPWLGVGLSQFTTQVEKFSTTKEVVKFLQPAHHIGLLWVSETGMLGVAFIGILLATLKFRTKLLTSRKLLLFLCLFIPLMSLDHYLLTNQVGILLTPLFFLFLRFM